jgi:hypothetical protein
LHCHGIDRALAGHWRGIGGALAGHWQETAKQRPCIGGALAEQRRVLITAVYHIGKAGSPMSLHGIKQKHNNNSN